KYTYDLNGGRRAIEIGKLGTLCSQFYFLVIEDQEIGLYDANGNLIQLRVPGAAPYEDMVQPIAIETPDATYAPILSYSGNILKLVDTTTKEIISFDKLDPFAQNMMEYAISNPITPWIYAAKHCDSESGLIYFGSRYYDSDTRRWITLDPLGRVQVANLYNYVMNNPLLLIDEDGESFALAIPVLKWGAKKIAISFIPGIGQALTLISGAMALYESAKIGYQLYNKWKDEKTDPPYDGEKLGEDPSKCPGEGFEWKEKGSPSSGKGAWFNKRKEQFLHPDFNHPGDVKPHWDYNGPEGEAQLFLDGTWSPKP
ncbi:MAG: hypothetical protein HY860_01515, partial [Chlamydiales bacterium]|nr:hypothetical protein [Chlamydiales bacterium]